MNLVRSAVLVALGALLFGCGAESATAKRDDPDTVFAKSLQALSEADLPTLHTLLTPSGRAAFQADLRSFHEALRLKGAARVSLERLVEARFPGESTARMIAARDGGPRAALTLLVAIRPIAVPDKPRMRAGDTTRSYYYLDSQRVEREVRLVKGDEGWAVDRLGL